MKSLLIGCLFLVGCGTDVCEGSDFVTKQNMCVFRNGFDISQQKVEEVIDATQQEVTFRHPNTYPKEKIEKFDNVSLKFIEELKNKTDAGETEYEIGALADDNFQIKLEYKESQCSRRWFIFIHEILHVYLLDVSGDSSHRKDWFIMKEFSNEENNNSIQNLVFEKIRCISESD